MVKRNAAPFWWSSTIVVPALFAHAVWAGTMPIPMPSPSPAAAGPCAAPALPSIAVRPGIGRAPATSGAVCVAPPGVVIVSAGVRDQLTVGPAGQQHLEVYPAPVVLIGVVKRAELIVAPSLTYSHRVGTSGSGLPPAFGQQDAGIGAQYLLADRPAVQQALALIATLPTGYPNGPLGFSLGVPTYSLSYALAANFGNLGVSTSQGVTVASGPNPANAIRRYIAYVPTINVSYALATSTTLLLEDQITAPTGPQAPTGNRALCAVQQTLSANVVLDAEYEVNLLPAPGIRQHAFGAGLTVRL